MSTSAKMTLNPTQQALIYPCACPQFGIMKRPWNMASEVLSGRTGLNQLQDLPSQSLSLQRQKEK